MDSRNNLIKLLNKCETLSNFTKCKKSNKQNYKLKNYHYEVTL